MPSKSGQLPDTTYNGWKNYETCCMKLWLDNEKAHYDAVRRMVAEVRTLPDVQALCPPVAELSQKLRDYSETIVEIKLGRRLQSSFIADFVNQGLARIDWYEIAQNILDGDQHG